MPLAYVSEVYHGIRNRSLPHTHGYKSSGKRAKREEEGGGEVRLVETAGGDGWVSDNEHGTIWSVSSVRSSANTDGTSSP